jgi:hypothetical protein
MIESKISLIFLCLNDENDENDEEDKIRLNQRFH